MIRLEPVDPAGRADAGGAVPHKILVPVLVHPHILEALFLVGFQPLEDHSLDQFQRLLGFGGVRTVEEDAVLRRRPGDDDLWSERGHELIAGLPQYVQHVDEQTRLGDLAVLEPMERAVPEPRRVPGRGDVEPVVLERPDEVAGGTHPRTVPKLSAEEDVIVLFEVRERFEERPPIAATDLVAAGEPSDRRGTVPLRVRMVIFLQYVSDLVGPGSRIVPENSWTRSLHWL
ncbi:hypothetical protein SAMN04487946_109103 [Halobellus clavatus]|uniref:Uncharacterized protein n=1 Tax=Halobellus clavatus TaxID=660517 RepID=A0A1H3IBP8_9EURY|nr:hypothetical protein [Halobellus clavatus]SDY24952.1 hypothetical protein SAMN04487946_109103 [Halobellus clavatus]